jgi:predicted RNA-binding protein with PUA-like domain
MPNHWILKTEPTTYSYDDLTREKRTTWDGVKNAVALKHIRAMRRGDQALIYHSGKEKAVVGLAEVVSDPYADPEQNDPKLAVVDLEARKPLPRPVALKAIKADPTFKDLGLVRMGRLSVMPATPTQWKRLLQLGGR